jgi:hypothetical protein
MGCLPAALKTAASAALLLAGTAHGSGPLPARQAATTKYCFAGFGNVCYAQYATSSLQFRVAIPDANAAPFDALLEVTAPTAAAWVGVAWGGQMTNNPLTIAWPNGNGATVSSRWAT